MATTTDTFRENATRRFSISSLFMTLIVAQFLIIQIVIVVHEGNCQFYENYDEEDNFELDTTDFLLDNDDNHFRAESFDTEQNEIISEENEDHDKFTEDRSNKDDQLRHNHNHNHSHDDEDHHHHYDKNKHTWFQRKITVPAGTTLSLTTQVSRPDIAPGFFYDVDGILIDAVVEVPIWMSLNKFLEAAHNGSFYIIDDGDSDKKSFVGYERCFLYEKLESYAASVLEMSPLISHMCLLRAICETQTISFYYPLPPTNIVFELLHLLLTPSLGIEDDCYLPYLAAETIGQETGQCDKYAAFCPLNIAAVILSNFFPPDDYH